MKRSDEKQRLLEDVLGGDAGVWRQSALNAALKAGRRRRTIRYAQNGLATLTVAVLLTTLLWPGPPPAPSALSRPRSDFVVVRSIPLAREMWVRSTGSGFVLIGSAGPSVDRVHTDTTAPSPPVIGDDELLQLAGPGAALVRQASGEVVLLRLDDFPTPAEGPTPN